MWSLLFPPRCPVCGAAGPAPCPTCRRRLQPAGAVDCPPGIGRCRALLRYEGDGRRLVAGLKYRNARDALGWLADGLAGLAAEWAADLDAVTWSPTTAERRRQRGFDHAELLARATGRRLGLPTHRLLVRLAGPPQTGRGRLERRTGPRFEPRRPPPAGGRVLLVDDVVTTGATLAAAAAALRRGGAASVAAVVAGATRLKVAPVATDA